MAVENVDFATAVIDQALLLQAAGGNRDSAALYPEHVGQKLVGQVKVIGLRAVVGQQQPAREARFNKSLRCVTDKRPSKRFEEGSGMWVGTLESCST